MLSKLLRLGEGRMVKRLKGVADYVNTLSDDTEKLTDAELRAKTDEFRKRVADGADLDDLLPEAFAVAREAAWRVLSQRHFDVQVMGGAALHFGNVAEMKTGEGKTLTCVLPAYLNALGGKGVHVVTVNDYLAKRDSEWMGRVHRFLGLDVGVILSGEEVIPDGHHTKLLMSGLGVAPDERFLSLDLLPGNGVLKVAYVDNNHAAQPFTAHAVHIYLLIEIDEPAR